MWHAVYVETPALHQLPEKQRRAILSALRLAQELGAETATLSDPAEDKAVIRYAREHNPKNCAGTANHAPLVAQRLLC